MHDYRLSMSKGNAVADIIISLCKNRGSHSTKSIRTSRNGECVNC